MWWDVHGNPLVLCWSLSPIWVKLWNCPFDCLAVCPRRAQGFQLEALFSKQPFYLLTCICRRSLNLRTWLAPISWRRRNPKRYAVLLCSITLPQANLSLLPSSLPPSSLCSLPLILKIARQILEAHASMLTLSMHDAKLQYIRNWQALQDFGITYFLVKVGRSRKEVSKNSVSNLIPIPEFHPYYTHTHTTQFSAFHFHGICHIDFIESIWKFISAITRNSSDLCTMALPPMLFLDSLYNMFNVHVIDINKLTSTFTS